MGEIDHALDVVSEHILVAERVRHVLLQLIFIVFNDQEYDLLGIEIALEKVFGQVLLAHHLYDILCLLISELREFVILRHHLRFSFGFNLQTLRNRLRSRIRLLCLVNLIFNILLNIIVGNLLFLFDLLW